MTIEATNLLGGSFEQFAATYHAAVRGFLNINAPATRNVIVVNFAVMHQDEHLLRLALDTARLQLALPGTSREVTDREFLTRMTDPQCDPLATLMRRETGDGRVISLNLGRQARPQRDAGLTVDTLCPPYSYPKMSFFLHEALEEGIAVETWDGIWDGMTVTYTPNKHPSGWFHFMAVPDVPAAHPQYLTRRLVQFMWDLRPRVLKVLPRAIIGYNPYGGRGSLLQFHVQIMGDGEGLTFATNLAGTGIEVPTFGSADELWRAVDWLQRNNLPFNLILTPTSVEIVLRHFQGKFTEEDWTTGFAFNEWRGWVPVAGGLTNYRGVTDLMIVNQMQTLALHQRVPALA